MLVVLTDGDYYYIRYVSSEIPIGRFSAFGSVACLVVHAFQTDVVGCVEVPGTLKKSNAALADSMYLSSEISCGLHNKAVPDVVIGTVVIFGIAFSHIIAGFNDLARAYAVAVNLNF